MTRPLVLGIDPGFASLGYAIVSIGPADETITAMGVVRTVRATKKRRVRASDDNFERARELVGALQNLVRHHLIGRATLLVAESMSFPRNSSVAAKIAMCWGALAGVAVAENLPVLQATPQEIKRAVCGRRDASKEEVRERLLLRYGAGTVAALRLVPKSQWDHPFGALAAIVACLETDHIRLLRQSGT